ncbi:hypothetical protein [Streptomyces sp. NPDC047968]|uniref:hypothetical protein n=1 Tax=unclassified Streptomyces TaxID=2593676 RepID=UPI0034468637
MSELPEDVTDDELAAALALVRQRKAAAQDEDTIHVRGEGGSVFEMSLSRMSADMHRRLQMGRLRRVNPDGSPYQAAAGRAPAAAPGPAAHERSARPAKNRPKADWVVYAVAELGVDPDQAEQMTRQDLIDLADDDHPEDRPVAPGGRERPADDAPKADWIAYTVASGRLSAEDAANYTRADLIEMTQ